MAGKTFRRSAEVAPVFFQVELDDGKLLRFDCRRSVPGGVALAFADAGGLDEDASESQRGSAAIRATKALFEAAIVPDQQAKFWAMVNGQDPDGRDFVRAAFGSGCRHFTKILGPQANSLHANHFHLDMGRGDYCR